MELYDLISEQLLSHGVPLFAPLKLSDCLIVKPYLLEKAGIQDGSVVMCAVPYFSKKLLGDHNISAYCAVKDYHGFFEILKKEIPEALKKEYPDNKFAIFADHSPIDERHAAAIAGLGIIGLNGMLITEKYSSYIFLGELVTDAALPAVKKEIEYCIGCKKCKSACMIDELGSCLSAVTQKKGDLDEKEISFMQRYNTAWGCDVCQKVCPYTEKAIKNGTVFTETEYFLSDIIPDLDTDILNALDADAFAARAFSWRGKSTVERNLKILEKNHK